MADAVKTILSVTLTKNKKLSDLAISNESQLIFVEDLHTIVLDYHGKRTFYNQIQTVKTEEDRQTLTPINGSYYFVKDSVLLWTYQDNEWILLTQNSNNTVYIGIDKPSIGVDGILYVDKYHKDISVWDKETANYVVVGESVSTISHDDILNLFN